MQKAFLNIFLISVFLTGCTGNYTPRPYGYFRIELPEPHYSTLDTLQLPYSFEKSDAATIIARSAEGEKYWIDLVYPQLNASIHCSYKAVQGNLFALSEDARKYVYKHSVKADGIGETVFENPEKKIYGILYDLKGNTASSLQFVLTDSTKHFFRAALYIDNVPNKDSIAPVIEYLRKDVVQIMETFEWKR
jgi:gliding motility-associated lipoprotein GldD